MKEMPSRSLNISDSRLAAYTAGLVFTWGISRGCVAGMHVGREPVAQSLWALVPGLFLIIASAITWRMGNWKPLATACRLVLLRDAAALFMKLIEIGRGGQGAHAAMRLAVIGMDSVMLLGNIVMCIVLLRWISQRDQWWILCITPVILEVHRLVTMPADISYLVSGYGTWGLPTWFELFGVVSMAGSIVSVGALIPRFRSLAPAFAAHAFCAGHYALNIPLLRVLGMLEANWVSTCLALSIIARFCLHAALLAIIAHQMNGSGIWHRLLYLIPLNSRRKNSY